MKETDTELESQSHETGIHSSILAKTKVPSWHLNQLWHDYFPPVIDLQRLIKYWQQIDNGNQVELTHDIQVAMETG